MTVRGPEPPSTLALVGLDEDASRTYRILLRYAGAPVEMVARALGVPEEQLESRISVLLERELIELREGRLVASAPDVALTPLLADASAQMRVIHDQLDAVVALLPRLRREHAGETALPDNRIHGEVVAGGDLMALWEDLADDSEGEILQFRPDQWKLPSSPAMNLLVGRLLEEGRPLRTLYPAIALSQATEILRERHSAGEQIRLVATLPCRLVVFGNTAAIVPQDWAVNNDRRIVVRQEALIEALRFAFDRVWDTAVVVPGMPGAGPNRLSVDRRLLIDLMVKGYRDEQIADASGLSLRTVRRRIADLQDELGAGTRFAAGVEAVRAGWV